MKFIFVKKSSSEYKAGLKVRELVFFKNYSNAIDLLNDTFELESEHLVCINDTGQVVGTGRLTFKSEAIISQMAILPQFQKQGIGIKILKLLIEKSRNSKAKKVILSARVSALNFYNKAGFTTIGNVYPSKKTGVLHQDMEMYL